MPHGEVFFRKDKTATWVDVYDVYGISFTDASLSRLVTPPPKKENIENKSRLQHGKRVVRKTSYVRTDERNVSLEMHLSAPGKAAFWQRYRAFCADFLDNGFFEIRHRDFVDGYGNMLIFRVTYEACEEFSEFMQQLAKFTLTLNEPDPTNRGSVDKWETEQEELVSYQLSVTPSTVTVSGSTVTPAYITMKVLKVENNVVTEMYDMPFNHAIEVYADGEQIIWFNDAYDNNGWYQKFHDGEVPTLIFTEKSRLEFVLRGRTNVNEYDRKTITRAT